MEYEHPPEEPLNFIEAVARQKAHAEVMNEDYLLRAEKFIGSLGPQDLITFRDIMSVCASMGKGASAQYMGMANGRLSYELKVCPCGTKHDDGNDSMDEGLDNILGKGAEDLKAAALKAEPKDIAPHPVVNVILENALEYNVAFVTDDVMGPVQCRGCGTVNPSLADRMLRDPGVDGCGGCQHKAKFG